MDGNFEAMELLMMTGTQWRVGTRGAYGLDYPAVIQAAAILGIEMTPGLFKKIRAVEHQTLIKLQDQQEKGE